ncbi:MAG TPA: AsmA family protein [Acidobacteriaceae bacterium]
MKRILTIAGAALGVLILILILIPFFVSGNTFRPKLESMASQALGRKVQIGNLDFSLLSGSLSADNLSIADDPNFSQSPFLTASSLKIGVKVWPLITSKQLEVTSITIDKPVVHLISNASNQWNYSTLANTGKSTPSQPSSSKTENLTVGRLDVNHGEVTMMSAGAKSPSVYSNVEMETKNFSLASAFPVTLSMDLPGGGTMKLNGTAGPVNATNATFTPVEADVKIDSLDIAKSGFVEPSSGLSGIVDLTNHLSAANAKAHLKGVATMRKLKLAANGAPSGVPIAMDFDLDYSMPDTSGTLNSGLLHIGHAQANVKGTFATKAAVTSINMNAAGQGMPIDDIVAALPAFGVILPSGSTLHGGTLSMNVHAQGPSSALVATGNVGAFNTRLAGFDLGSKLSAVSKITGAHFPSGDTQIQRLTSNINYSPAGMQASNIDLVVAGIGQVTGSGTLSANNALNFHFVAQLNASGAGGAVGGVLGNSLGKSVSMTKLPFAVQGTASQPKIIPDVGGIVGGAVTGLAGSLGGVTKGSVGNTGAATQQLSKGLGGLLKH